MDILMDGQNDNQVLGREWLAAGGWMPSVDWLH
jgi:hypothetical protein